MENCSRCEREVELELTSSEFGECPECNEITEKEIASNEVIMDKVAERAKSQEIIQGIQERLGRFYD
jgi:peptide subunit release factor 1 (eRF1)